MKFLADEDVPLPSVHLLRDLGFDIESIVEDAAGSLDPEVLARAVRDERVLITRDRDFGKLVIKEGRAAPPALIYVRDSGRDPRSVGRLVSALIAHDGEAILDRFVVVKPRRHRSVRLR